MQHAPDRKLSRRAASLTASGAVAIVTLWCIAPDPTPPPELPVTTAWDDRPLRSATTTHDAPPPPPAARPRFRQQGLANVLLALGVPVRDDDSTRRLPEEWAHDIARCLEWVPAAETLHGAGSSAFAAITRDLKVHLANGGARITLARDFELPDGYIHAWGLVPEYPGDTSIRLRVGGWRVHLTFPKGLAGTPTPHDPRWELSLQRSLPPVDWISSK